MQDAHKTKTQLLDELKKLQRRNKKLDSLLANLKAADEHLKETRGFYETILESILNGVWVSDKDDVLFYANKGAEIISGLSRKQITRGNLFENFQEQTLQYFTPFYLKAKETLKPIYFDSIPVKTSVGRQSYQSGWLIPRIKNGAYDGMVCTVEDVTSRKVAEDELRTAQELLEKRVAERTAELLKVNEQLRSEIKERKHAKEALLISEARYKDLFNNSRNAIAVYEALEDGKNFIFKDFNYAAEKIEQISKEEVIGKCVTKVFPGVKEFGLLEVLQRVWKTGKPEDFPISFYKDDRVSGWKENYAYKLPSGEIVVIYEDITERKQAELKIQQEVNFNKTLIESSPAFIVAIAPDGKTLLMNKSMLQALGYTNDEMAGKDYLSHFVPVAERETLSAVFKNIVRLKESTVNENHILTKDGEELLVEWHGIPVLNEKGAFEYFIGVGIDITERKLAEEALLESEEKYRTLVERANDGIIIIQDATIKYANQRMAELDGSSVEQLVGTPFIDHVHPDEVPRLMENYRRRMAGESIPSIYETVLQRWDGKNTPAELNIAIIKYQGRPAALVMIRDITERKQLETELRTASLYARSLIEASIDPLVTISPEGKITDVNKATEQVTGIAREQLIESDFSEYFTEPEEARRGYQTVITHGQVRDYPLTIRHASGSTTDVLYNATLYRNEAGEVQGVFADARDITEYKASEEKLEEAKEQLEKFLANSIDPIVVGDSTGCVAKPNKAFLDMLGYAEEEIIGKKVHSLSITETGTYESTTGEMVTITEDFFRESSAKVKQFIEEGKISSWESYYTHKSGKIVPVAQNTVLLYDDDGKRSSSFNVIRDLTEQKKAEAALRVSEEHFRAIAESSMDAIITSDTQNNIIFCNRAAERIYGYSKEELMGKPAAQLTPERLRERNKTSFKNALEKEMPRLAGKPLEVLGLRKDQQEFPAEVSVTTYKIDDKLYFTATIHDITERKKLQEQLFQTQKMEAIGTLAGGIAHDFNNILAAIMGNTEMAMQILPAYSTAYKHLDQVTKSSYRAKNLVQQILAFSRKSDEDKHPLELRKIIHEAIEMLRSTLPTTIDIQTTIASDAWVMGNVIQMHQVLMNLCTNASHAMREKGGVLGINVCDVTVTAENVRLYHELPPGSYVKLSVSDTGTGIAPEFINRVFEPFFTTKGVGEGSGMGLSVVYGIVKNQGGDITVESELGKGTTFQVLLPRIEQKVKEEEKVEEPIPKGTERVLLVDDEEVIIDIGQKLLEMLGYQVTATSSSAEALEIFQKEPEKFDLVITDYTMPHMTGYELAKRLMDIRPDIPILLCTGYNESISPDKAKTLGIREFIMKPLDLRLMGEVIRKVLDNKSA